MYIVKLGDWLLLIFETVCRNGTYVWFLHTKEWYVHIIALYEETIRRTISSSPFLCINIPTISSYKEMVRMYHCFIHMYHFPYKEMVHIPFLCTKKR